MTEEQRERKKKYFQKRYQENQVEVKARSKLWAENNRDKRKAISKKWKLENPDKNSAKIRRAENLDKVRLYYRNYTNHRRRSDPQFWLKARIRSRMNHALTGRTKSNSSVQFLGCTVEDALKYLASKFVPGMSLENRGKVWHIDHVKPLSSFNLEDLDQYAEACHYTNLQPLFIQDNLSKGNKLDWDKPPQYSV